MGRWPTCLTLLGGLLLLEQQGVEAFLLLATRAAPSSGAHASAPTVRAATGGGARAEIGPTVYRPKGWDRDIYRPPDNILFEWQELKCCLEYMEQKEVNAAALAPETRATMIGYMEAIMTRGAPINTYDGLRAALKGKWKMSFTTEDRYKALPPGSRVYMNVVSDTGLQNIIKFKDNVWDGMVSTGKYEVTEQGRVLFKFEDSYIKVVNPMGKGSSKMGLPSNMGNMVSTFVDVSYIDGTMWFELLVDPQTKTLFHTVYEYCGPCQGYEEDTTMEVGQ